MRSDKHISKVKKHRRLGYCLLAALLLVGMHTSISWSETEPMEMTQELDKKLRMVWDGVYTDAQAAAGQEVFKVKCEACHGEIIAEDAEFQGPPLKGEKFFDNWREDHLASLYMKIRSSMPLLQASLSDLEYLVITAYILQENDFPSGRVGLSRNSLRDIWIQGKDGPRPLPGNSLIQTIGCLRQVEGKWMLTLAGRPIRNRNPDPERKPTSEELYVAATEPPGTLTFQLANFFMLGDFDPTSHEGQKMLARGALIRRPNVDRISVTGLDTVAPSCDQ